MEILDERSSYYEDYPSQKAALSLYQLPYYTTISQVLETT